MIDYFDLYKLVLTTIRDDKVKDGHDLFEAMSQKTEIIEMQNKFPAELMVNATLEVLNNLLDDGLIVGQRRPTKDITLYQIEHLSTAGHIYLQGLIAPSSKEKVLNYLKVNGLPTTPQSVLKAIFNMVF